MIQVPELVGLLRKAPQLEEPQSGNDQFRQLGTHVNFKWVTTFLILDVFCLVLICFSVQYWYLRHYRS